MRSSGTWAPLTIQTKKRFSHTPVVNNSMRKSSYLAIVIIFIISCVVYAGTLFNGFVYDDVPQVLENLWIIDFTKIPKIFTSSAWSFMGEEQSFHYYRPMMHTIYTIEYMLFTLNPLYWHLVNIVFHALNGVLVFLVASVLLTPVESSDVGAVNRGLKERFPVLPFVAALFFALHPVATESVAWVAAIPELSYAAFALLSFYLYIKSSREPSAERSTHSFLLSPSYLLSLVFFFVSLFCKEPAMMLLLVLFAYDYSRGKKLISKLMLSRYTLFVILAIIYLFIRNNALGGLGPKFTEHFYLSSFQNFLNIGPLVFSYFTNLILPMKFSPFYVFYPVFSLAEFQALYSWALLLILLAGYIYLFVKRKPAFVAATLLLAPLLPVLYIPALSTSVFAVRYLYLPVAGLGILLALLVRFVLIKTKSAPAKLPINSFIMIIILSVLFSIFTYKTSTRSVIWKSDLTLWEETVRLYPKNYHAQLSIAKSYMDAGEIELAKEGYARSIKYNLELVHPKELALAESWYNLGLLQFDSGEIDKSINSYNESLRINVKRTLTRDVLNNLGNAYASAGKIDEAIRSLERALAIDPTDTYVRHNLEEVRKWKKR